MSLIFTIIFMIIFFLILGIVNHFINEIEVYEKASLEEIYLRDDLREKHSIKDKDDPGDFGFEYKTISLYIENEKINIVGWYISSKNKESKKTIIFLHGRTANKLSVLQYLEIIKNNKIDKEYSIFIPDLRNSGDSDESRTYMGYKTANDLYHSMIMLKKKYRKTKFIIYSWSMGAMTSLVALDKYKLELEEEKIIIEKIILDSPLSNVSKIIRYDAKRRKIPKVIIDISMMIFNIRIDFYLENMRVKKLIKDLEIPILLLQGKEDLVTPHEFIEYEIQDCNFVEYKLYDKGDHVQIYKENKESYDEEVSNFIKK